MRYISNSFYFILDGMALNKKLPQLFAYASAGEVIRFNQLKHLVGFSGKEFYYPENDSAANKFILVSGRGFSPSSLWLAA